MRIFNLLVVLKLFLLLLAFRLGSSELLVDVLVFLVFLVAEAKHAQHPVHGAGARAHLGSPVIDGLALAELESQVFLSTHLHVDVVVAAHIFTAKVPIFSCVYGPFAIGASDLFTRKFVSVCVVAREGSLSDG